MSASKQSSSLFFSFRLLSYIELMRPANIITAFADILAGFAAADGIMLFEQANNTPSGLGWLLISTLGLYGGGVVLNDVFDARLDKRERPERAIPSGNVSRTGAALFGAGLLALGVITAFIVSSISGILAIIIVACIIFYNAKAKHSMVLGPLFMGLCRGGNLLLGCSIIPAVLPRLWFLALIPIAYIGSITLISQGEIHGGTKASGFFALGLLVLIIASLLILAVLPAYRILVAIPFLFIFSLAVLPPFYKAALTPSPTYLKKAVKRGVISLILLDSVLAAGFGGFIVGGLILALTLVSLLCAKFFAVT